MTRTEANCVDRYGDEPLMMSIMKKINKTDDDRFASDGEKKKSVPERWHL